MIIRKETHSHTCTQTQLDVRQSTNNTLKNTNMCIMTPKLHEKRLNRSKAMWTSTELKGTIHQTNFFCWYFGHHWLT